MKSNSQTILVVEDDKPQREALVEKLGREGFKVSQAVNGIEGLEKALAGHPRLILLDIVMPQMDGISMLKELRKDEWGKTAPVLVLTNLSSPQVAGELVEGHQAGFLVKANWTLQDLLNKIREIIKS